MGVRECGDEDGLLNWMGVCESRTWPCLSVQVQRVLREGVKPALWEWNIQFIQHNVSYCFHGFHCNIMSWKLLAMLAAYQVLRPNFEETLHFLYAISYCKPWKGLSESVTIHTPMCRFGMTRKWYLLAGFRSLKATNVSSWGIIIKFKDRCWRVQYSAYLIHNVEFTSRRLLPTKFAWI